MDISKILHEAVEERRNGCILHIKTKIGKRSMFPAGFDNWRKRIEIEIDEMPEKGKANKRILEIMAQFFGLKGKAIKIEYGHKSKEKGIWIEMKKEEVIEKLKNGL